MENNFVQEITQRIRSNSENFNRAINYANKNACIEITDEKQKSECHDYAIIAKVTKNGDQNLCLAVEDENRKNECYSVGIEKKAIDTENTEICKNITDEKIKLRCTENIDAKKLQKIVTAGHINIESCRELSGNFRLECEKLLKNYQSEENYIKAIQSENLAICATVGEKSLEEKCRNTILNNRAEKEKNPTICEQISHSDTKIACIQKIQNNQENIIFETATKNENIVLCQSIKTESLQKSCHDIILLSNIKKTKNYILCDSLLNTENKNICKNLK